MEGDNTDKLVVNWDEIKQKFNSTFSYSGGVIRQAVNGNFDTAKPNEVKAASLQDIYSFFESELNTEE